MSENTNTKSGMKYQVLKRTKRVKLDEHARAEKRANKDITKMTTGEVFLRLYDRHKAGFWMSASLLLGVSTILAVIY